MAHSVHQRANFPKNLRLAKEEHQEPSTNDLRAFGIAAKTWEASFALLHYLLPQPHPHPVQYEPPSPLLNAALDIHIIDLGSGTCHLATQLLQTLHSCSYSNISITVTDLPEVLPLLERNISRLKLNHPSHTISARALTWGNTQETIAVLNSLPSRVKPSSENTELLITCSDLVFFPFLFIPLLRTLLLLTAPPPQLLNTTTADDDDTPFATPVVVLFGYKQRCAIKEFPFFELLGRYFKLEPIVSRCKSTDPWELTRPTTNNTHEEEAEEEGGSNNLIYLLRATRHASTKNKELDQLVLDSLLSKTPADQETDINTTEQQDPLFTLGDASAADQWEWILLSNLSDHQLFS